MRLEKSVGSGDCWIVEGLIAYFNMVTVPYKMVGLKNMSDYRGVRLERFTEYSLIYNSKHAGHFYDPHFSQCMHNSWQTSNRPSMPRQWD